MGYWESMYSLCQSWMLRCSFIVISLPLLRPGSWPIPQVQPTPNKFFAICSTHVLGTFLVKLGSSQKIQRFIQVSRTVRQSGQKRSHGTSLRFRKARKLIIGCVWKWKDIQTIECNRRNGVRTDHWESRHIRDRDSLRGEVPFSWNL